MANIVEKYPFIGTTGQCLILNPRERLVYPFSFGDYSEIRLGLYYSFTRATGNNLEVFTDEGTKSTAITEMFLGFGTYNTGASLLPGISGGYDYIGLGNGTSTRGINVQNATESWLDGGNVSNAAYHNFIVTNLTGAYNTFGSSSSVLAYFPTKATGASNYASLLGLQLTFSGTSAFTTRCFNNSNTFTTDTSTANLRNDVSVLGTSRSAYSTGFYTTGCVGGSANMAKPNSLIVYCPLLNSSMRIHNLIVERYA